MKYAFPPFFSHPLAFPFLFFPSYKFFILLSAMKDVLVTFFRTEVKE